MRRFVRSTAVLAALAACADAPSDDLPALPGEAKTGDAFGVFAGGGIELHRIVVDQGVAIDVAERGEIIATEDRSTLIIAGRAALVRAFWSVPDDWTPRPIVARLRIHDGETTHDATRTLDVDGDAVENWFDGAFSFYLPAELVTAGGAIDVTLYEAPGTPEPELPPAVPPRLPSEGTIDLDADPQPREIDVVIVPVDHDFDGGKACPDEAPSFDAARLQVFSDALMASNPVQRASVSVRPEPLVWSESAAQLSQLLDRLGELRAEDDAPPWVYYFAAIEPCDWGSDEGYAGLAFLPRSTTPEEAFRRVSIGDVAVSESSTIETFVHEIGHNQERRHVPCGQPKGAVEDYPHRDGKLGAFGFDIVRWVLHLPTHRDYMSYCGPAWVSDYGWTPVAEVAAELTDWKRRNVRAAAGPGMLVGARYADGSEAFWTLPGRAPVDPSAAGSAEFRAHGDMLAHTPMTVTERADGSIEIVAPLAAPPDMWTEVELHGGPFADPVPRARVRVHAGATR